MAPSWRSSHNRAVRFPPQSAMPYIVQADEQHQLVEVVYSGQITVSTRICAMEDGALLLDAHQYARVLVDLTAATAATEPADAAHGYAARMAHRPRARNSRLAYVTLPGQHSGLLMETIASTRHAELRHFHARAEALHWLLTGT
jgi:hypothetical protein